MGNCCCCGETTPRAAMFYDPLTGNFHPPNSFVNRNRNKDVPVEKMCIICCEDLSNAPASSFVTCSGGGQHRICSGGIHSNGHHNGCFNRFIDITWCEMDHGIGVVPKVKCCAHNCEGTFSEHTVANNVQQYAYTKYASKMERAKAGVVVAEVRERLQKAGACEQQADSILFAVQMEHQLQGVAHMCPRCKTPVVIDGCDNLLTHHNQKLTNKRNENNKPISNTCGLCKFFAPQRYMWMKWDGVTRSRAECLRELIKSKRVDQGEDSQNDDLNWSEQL